MDSQSQIKVVNAGFTIIRDDDQPTIRIKYKDKNQKEWKTLQSFPSKYQRDKEMNNLLLRPDVVRD